VAVAIPRDLPPVFVDGVLLEQVFYNLLENAAKHTPTGTMVEIDARATEREITVTVADNGPGLRPGDEAKVFEKFHRGHREPSVVGIGLGLTICRAIIEAHGGSAVVESRAGLGAVFKLTLPRGQEPPPPAP
jgi:two-component system sensor histidine kinase KdpD